MFLVRWLFNCPLAVILHFIHMLKLKVITRLKSSLGMAVCVPVCPSVVRFYYLGDFVTMEPILFSQLEWIVLFLEIQPLCAGAD